MSHVYFLSLVSKAVVLDEIDLKANSVDSRYVSINFFEVGWDCMYNIYSVVVVVHYIFLIFLQSTVT